MNRPEILAPCGSIASLKGAIAAGADAVYIGGKKFGARAFADNPEEEELTSAIDFVHINGKKIYMTVNTLLKEKELYDELYNTMVPYYEHGLDAAIVQDLGVLEFLKKEFPELPLHASTQMTVTTAYGAELLKEKYGITRVVPSRELSLTEIRRFREQTDLEMECFVHGALCYSYSGQCLLSSMIGGRSGNRGRCAQPCRMKYDLLLNSKKVGESYALSLKDMCTLELLPDLIEAGIDSFKIEGRMKRPEYTAGITSFYRDVTDKFCSMGRENYERFLKDNPDYLEDLMNKARELYNRGGFSAGYYLKYHGKDMMSTNRPNHSGIKVGTVSDNSSGRISIRVTEELNPQDVLEIRGADTFEFTVGAEGAENLRRSKDRLYEVNASKTLKLAKGSEVFRTKNTQLYNSLEERYLKKEAKGGISGIFYGKVGEPSYLSVSFEGTSFTAYGDTVQEASSRPMTEEAVREVLLKTGEAEFDFESLTVSVTGNAFIPVGAIKKIRRDAFAGLIEEILKAKGRKAAEEPHVFRETQNPAPKADERELIVSVTDDAQLDEVLTFDEIDCVYIDAQEIKISEQLEMYRKAEAAGKKTFLVLPRIFRLKERERYERELPEESIRFVANSIDELEFLREKHKDCEYRISEAVYVTNSMAKKTLYDRFGIDRYTVSLELNFRELKEMETDDCDFIIYERTKVMHTAQCLCDNNIGCRKNHLSDRGALVLKDGTGAEFPVRTNCPSCVNTIYNSKVYSLIGCRELDEMEVRGHIISFTLEERNEVKRVLEAYFSGEMLKGDYTRGHFRRGVE